MAIPAAQAETAALLGGLAGAPPVETHISAVFLGADTVWKLRKAVRFPFVDFTPLAERRRTALREVELNSAAAPASSIERLVRFICFLPFQLDAAGLSEPARFCAGTAGARVLPIARLRCA